MSLDREDSFTGYQPLFSEYSITGTVTLRGDFRKPPQGAFDASTAELYGTVRADHREIGFALDDPDTSLVEIMIAGAAAHLPHDDGRFDGARLTLPCKRTVMLAAAFDAAHRPVAQSGLTADFL